MPPPTLLDDKRSKKEIRSRDRDRMSRRSLQSGSHRSHLSDPSHSPPSEMDRYECGSHRRQISSISRRLLRLNDYNPGGFDSRSSASLMEAVSIRIYYSNQREETQGITNLALCLTVIMDNLVQKRPYSEMMIFG